MVATCEDDFSIPSDITQPVEKKHQNTTYSYFWERRDTDLNSRREFLGVSLHPSIEDRILFFDKLRESDIRKYGKDVPDVYYNPIFEAEHIVSSNFYQFMQRESMFRSVKGIFILEPNLIHLLNFKQVLGNEKSFTDIVKTLNGKYSPELMTINRLYKEITQDTNLWYVNMQ